MTCLQNKRQRKATTHTNSRINPPHCPRHLPPLPAPRGYTHKRHHVYNRRQPHRECPQKQTLRRMSYHRRPDPGVDDIPQDGDEQKCDKEEDVEAEDDVGDVL